jgi:aminobenzoyl-glutamate utilization protein B
MMHAARIMTLVGIDLYADPVHLERARREFAQRTAGTPYRSPLPADLAAPQYPERAGAIRAGSPGPRASPPPP